MMQNKTREPRRPGNATHEQPKGVEGAAQDGHWGGAPYTGNASSDEAARVDMADTTDEDRAPPMRGIKVIAETLRGEDFPMERQDIDYSIGDMEIEDGHGGFVPVRDLTDQMGQETFTSAEAVIRALQGVLHGRGKAA